MITQDFVAQMKGRRVTVSISVEDQGKDHVAGNLCHALHRQMMNNDVIGICLGNDEAEIFWFTPVEVRSTVEWHK